jgi:hypothetical protein
MTKFRKVLMVVLFLVFVLNCSFALAHQDPADASDAKAEVWELQLTGDTEGTLELVLRRAKIEKDIYSIKGEFSGNIIDHVGGQGKCVCQLKGIIYKNVVMADFNGPVETADTEVDLKGTMKGTISDTKGFGTFSLTHSMGISDGEWTIKKTGREKVKETGTQRLKLRSTPIPTFDSDIEMIIRDYNFFVKYRNEEGEFPNDFVDNGDGTITDRATGLMWEKGGSSSASRYVSARRYVSRLNEESFAGYRGWRIPTTEELASLLERDRNNKGLHISSLFDARQKECWTSDSGQGPRAEMIVNTAIDFSDGSIDLTKVSESTVSGLGNEEEQCFVRAVRSIK